MNPALDYLTRLASPHTAERARLRAQFRRLSPADFEDLLQELSLRILSLDRPRLQRIRTPIAFAVTTAKHIAIDWQRRQAAVPIHSVPDVAAHVPVPDDRLVEDDVHAHQEFRSLVRLSTTLPTRSLDILIDRRVHGLSRKRIAERFRLSENVVEDHINTALRHLKALRSRIAA
jgi:RNA polymerase sigma factor (sigma-70 family)